MCLQDFSMYCTMLGKQVQVWDEKLFVEIKAKKVSDDADEQTKAL